MASKQDVLFLLRQYSVQRRSHILPFGDLVSFSAKTAEESKSEHPSLASLGENTALQLVSILEDLREDELCSMQYEEGKLSTVTFPGFFIYLVRRKLRDIEANPGIPFPTETTLDVTIPPNMITSVEIKKDFIPLLSETEKEEPKLLRLLFPEDIRSFIVPSDFLKQDLLRLSLAGVRVYLNTQRNAFYVLSKLRSIFKDREQILKDMINAILTQRAQALESITNPTEFAFGFWTHLANVIIKEFKEKTSKLEKEHTFCQVAYLLGFYAVYHKKIHQQQKDTAAAFRTLDRKLRQTPYYFTITDISNITDDHRVPLTSKYSREQLHQYIDEKLKRKGDSLPDLLRVRLPDRKEYFICKEVYLPLTLKKLQSASKECRDFFTDKWKGLIEAARREKEFKSDETFLTNLEDHLSKEDPLLRALLNFELLFLALHDAKPSYEISTEVERILDVNAKKLIPMDRMLRLDRRQLLSSVKALLPFWKTIPILNRFIRALRGGFSGAGSSKEAARNSSVGAPAGMSSQAPSTVAAKTLGSGGRSPSVATASPPTVRASRQGSSSATSAKARAIALQKAMSGLKTQFVGETSMSQALSKLAEKWNPLYDPQAKANLVEDVNSLVRDFLRRLKRGFLIKPPDAARIRTMAATLVENDAFEKIKRKDELREYIALYMIKVLGGV